MSAILVIGSDRGFCGGFNGNLNRFLDGILKEEEREFSVAAVGKRIKIIAAAATTRRTWNLPALVIILALTRLGRLPAS